MESVNTKSGMNPGGLEISFSALILAAGTSGRMGADKASLSYDDRKSFINHLEDSYLEANANPVILVVNPRFAQEGEKNSFTSIVVNCEPEKGRSHSICLGMMKVPPGNACFIQNVDNPIGDSKLLMSMLNLLRKDSYVVPVCNGKGGHPILIAPMIVEHINRLDKMDDLRAILASFARINCPWPDDKILLNINTPQDYERFLKLK
jgi:molybdenum cofactor cytidylyltransferase